MSAFADSSAVVKLYADEHGHALVRDLPVVVVSQLARVEVPAACWRKYRMGQLTPDQVTVLVAAFEADYFGAPDEQPRFAVVAADASILDSAARLVAIHGLRAYDAVQLASALAVRLVDPECRTFVAFGAELTAAAAAEGFDVAT